MTQEPLSTDGRECTDCRSVVPDGAKFCDACGCTDLRLRAQSRFPYDALAAFIGVIAVILFWFARS